MEPKNEQRTPLCIKNLAELKRCIRPGTELVATSHSKHPALVGLARVATEVQTNAYYSVVKDQPTHQYSACNYGKGFRSDFEKASSYLFEGTTIKVLDRRSGDGSVLYEMELYPGECLVPGQKSDTEENEEIREGDCEIKQEGMSMTLAKCYAAWNQIRDELNECYGSRTPREHLPLSQQKEFRRIKNDIIREAENIRLGLPTFEDEKMQDEPEPEAAHEEQRSHSVYEQAHRYRAAKMILQDVYALDEEHAEAVRVLEQLWAEGYTVAAHQLGKFYQDDLSTMRDHEKAERWFRLSAEAGNDFSEYALGKLLLSQKRTGEAVRWLDKAAGHGNPFAQYLLGKLYLAGESVEKDAAKALEYLTSAASQGNAFAQYTLGKLYLLGRDVKQDREKARDWFTRSAAQGNEYTQFFLDRFDQFRDPSVMLAATKLLHRMGRIFRDNSVPPHNPAGIRIDSKRRKRLMEKRMAMGHKADDHEEQVSYQQTM